MRRSYGDRLEEGFRMLNDEDDEPVEDALSGLSLVAMEEEDQAEEEVPEGLDDILSRPPLQRDGKHGIISRESPGEGKESDKMAHDATELAPLSEREIALARGDEPDDPVDEAPAEEQGDDEGAGDETDEDTDEAGGEGDEEPGQDADATGGDGGGKDAAGASEPDWRDGLAEEAARHGLTREELGFFGNEAQYRLFVKLAGKREPTPEEPEPDAPALDLQAFIDAEYSDETLELVKATIAAQERIKSLEAKLSEVEPELTRVREQYARELGEHRMEAFHTVMDDVDPSVFGKKVVNGRLAPLSAEHQQRREQVFKAAEVLEKTLHQAGLDVPARPELVRRAAQAVFGAELKQAETRRTKDRIAAQAKRRRGVAGGTGQATHPPSDVDPHSVEAIANRPEIVKFWRTVQEENGE